MFFTSFQRDVNKDVEQIVSYAEIYFKNVPEPLVFGFMHPDSIASFRRATRRELPRLSAFCQHTYIHQADLCLHLHKVLAAKVSIS